jgi:predicted aspartyl protease
MITGVVTANHEATIPLVVHGAHGQQETIDAVIDMGFTGSVTLPLMLITAPGLSWRGRQRVMRCCAPSSPRCPIRRSADLAAVVLRGRLRI